jgi:hypothetical protein
MEERLVVQRIGLGDVLARRETRIEVRADGARGQERATAAAHAAVAQTSEEGDRFGGAIALGDYDADGVPDLFAGAPFEDLGSEPFAGNVVTLYADPAEVADPFSSGFAFDARFVAGESFDAGDYFGTAIAVSREGRVAVGATGDRPGVGRRVRGAGSDESGWGRGRADRDGRAARAGGGGAPGSLKRVASHTNAAGSNAFARATRPPASMARPMRARNASKRHAFATRSAPMRQLSHETANREARARKHSCRRPESR